MCFYKNLRKYREAKGFSQKQMAELLEIAPSTYSLYESGKREPDVLKIHAIAKILRISGDLLLFGRDNPFGEKDEAIELYKLLDDNDKAEIRGEMKQMLKADKYSNNKTSYNSKIIDVGRAAAYGGETAELEITEEKAKRIRELRDKIMENE